MIRIPKFKLDFILHTYNTTLEAVKTSLAEFGEKLDISEVVDPSQKGTNFKININTEDPTIVFDVCSQFGRIRSVKVEEEGRQS
jgi:P2-related tail formation protein